MALKSVRQYCEEDFAPGSAPHPKTVRRHIDQGLIAGQKIGGRYYVEPDKEVVKPVNDLAARIFYVADKSKEPA